MTAVGRLAFDLILHIFLCVRLSVVAVVFQERGELHELEKGTCVHVYEAIYVDFSY